MKNIKKSRNISKILPLFGIVVTMFLGTAFANISNITGSIAVTAESPLQNGVFISDIEYVSNIGADITNSKINTYIGRMMSSKIVLSSSEGNSSITYKVKLYNSTEYIYSFIGTKYDESFYDNENITFQVGETGAKIGEYIYPKQEIEVYITFKYESGQVERNNTLNSYINFEVEVPAPEVKIEPESKEEYCKTEDITITAKDISLHGLATNNSYQYYISTSKTTPTGGSWKDYTSGVTQKIGSGLSGEYYIYIKQIFDTIGTGSRSTNGEYHIFGPYKFDNTEPITTLTGEASTTIATQGTMTATFQDIDSGIEKVIWYYKKSSESTYTTLTTDKYVKDTDITGPIDTISKTQELTGLTPGETYNLKVEVYDVAGNVKTVTKDITTGMITLTLSANRTTITPSTGKSSTFTAKTNITTGGNMTYKIYVSSANKNTQTTTGSSITYAYTTTFGVVNAYATVDDGYGHTIKSNEITITDYTIGTKAELETFRNSVNSGTTYAGITVTQVANINLNNSSSSQWTPIGNTVNWFKGTYEGNNKTISGIYISNSSNYQGLFGYVNGTLIRNLGLASGTVKGASYVGGIAGYASNKAEINSCYNKASITGTKNYTGGVVGALQSSSSCNTSYNTGAVTGVSHVGGIVGYNQTNARTWRCYNIGTVKATGNYTGGICGLSFTNSKSAIGYITECYNKGNVSSTGDDVGGIVGQNSNAICYVYNTGVISGGTYTAGIAGLTYGDFGSIAGAYNAGYLMSTTGYIGAVTVTEGSTGSISGTYYLVNTCSSAGSAIVKTAAELKGLASALSSTYFKTDTNNINNGYPILKWQ